MRVPGANVLGVFASAVGDILGSKNGFAANMEVHEVTCCWMAAALVCVNVPEIEYRQVLGLDEICGTFGL